jgi:signal transduction histidine kinase
MRLASAEVWTGAAGRLERSVSLPHRDDLAVIELGAKEAPVVARAGISGGTWLGVWLPALVAGRDASLVRAAPIAHAGELLGLIVVERRPESEAFSDDDDRVLVELARQIGLALHNVQLDSALQESVDELRRTNEELKASRTRIVAAGDDERRRLERNLHDGAQQHLVALAVKIRLARDAVEDDPADALIMLDELKGDIREAVTELRALAHGIFPPLLMAGGLPDALPAAANRAALPTTLTADGVGRYSQDVETAVYFCCLEALQTAGKHAGEGASAEVRVWEEAGTLRFEVADNGAGFDLAGAPAVGHGFVNMSDRLGAIDGTLSLVSAPGQGSRVRGTIPLGG